LGFVRPPAALLLALGVLVGVYLACALLLNRWFLRRFG